MASALQLPPLSIVPLFSEDAGRKREIKPDLILPFETLINKVRT